MSQRPVPIACPACGADIPATLARADGGSPELGNSLYGEDVTCNDCTAEFELLFYLD